MSSIMTDMWREDGGDKSVGHVRPEALYCYFVFSPCPGQINIHHLACSMKKFYFVSLTYNCNFPACLIFIFVEKI